MSLIILKSLVPEYQKCTNYYLKKEIIASGSSFYKKVYFIKNGIVKISSIKENGEQIIYFLLTAGQFFGANTMIDNFCFDYICEAQYTITEILEFDTTFFQKNKSNTNSQKRIDFLRIVHQYYIELERRIQTLCIRNAEQKLLQVFIEFKDKFDYRLDPNNQIVISMPLNQEELSNYIGVTRVTINKIINKLKRNHLIKYNQNTVTLTKKFFEYHKTF